MEVGDKCYASVLLEGLPAHWFGSFSETTKRDVLNPGVSVLEESCCDKDSKKSILKTSFPSTSEHRVQLGSVFPGMKATVLVVVWENTPVNVVQLPVTKIARTGRGGWTVLVMIKGKGKVTEHQDVIVQESGYGEILARTATQFGLQCQRRDRQFMITGNLDMLMEFRKAFDKAVMAHGTSASVEEVSTAVNALDEYSSASAVGGALAVGDASVVGGAFAVGDASVVGGAFAVGDAGSVRDSFPSSEFDSSGGLSTDVLTILAKVPEGRIPGLHYAAGEGVVYIRKDIREDVIPKFQNAYQGLLGKKMKVKLVDLPVECSEAAVTKILEDFNARYPNCDFSLVKDPWGVKILSNSSRQFETAKKLLLDQVLCVPLYTIPLPGGRTLTLKRADIVAEDVDVIVNAANGSLKHGGGVAMAIDRASNGAVQLHSNAHMRKRNFKDLRVGSVAPTPAGGSLKCKRVLHAIGPTSSHYDCEKMLNLLIRNILNEAKKMKVKSIAIPAISSGIFGVDRNLVARCIIDSLVQYEYPQNPVLISDIRVVIIDQPTYQCFVSYLQKRGLLPTWTAKKTSSASGLGSSTERDGFGAKDSDEKKAEAMEVSSDVSGNSELASFLPLLSPIASKWNVLAATLRLPEDVILRLSALSEDSARLEQVIQGWWHSNLGIGQRDRLEMLITALGSSDVGGRDVAAEVWKVHSVAYPTEVPSITNETSASSAQGSDTDRKSSKDPSTPYGTPPSDIDTGAVTDMAKLEAAATTLASSETTAVGTPAGAVMMSYGRSASDPSGGSATATADRHLIAEHLPDESMPETPPGFMHRGVPENATAADSQGPQTGVSGVHGPHATSGGHGATAGSHGSQAAAFGDRPGASDHGPKTGEYAASVTSSSTASKLAETPTAPPPNIECSICLDSFKDRVTTLCGHDFCRGCIEKWLSSHSSCPVCLKVLQPLRGNQPPGGTMICAVYPQALPGYHQTSMIVIDYQIPDGIQSSAHPHPGNMFRGTRRRAYLPNNKEGREVARLLQRAFDASMTFTVGTSHTTGQSDVVVWNDIHHKTSSGSGHFGYPDPDYLRRVKEELAAKGIVP